MSRLVNTLFNNKIEPKANKTYIACSIRGKSKKMYFDNSTFNEIFKNYIIQKLEEEKPIKTDVKNNVSIHNANNTFYIDLDFYTNTDQHDLNKVNEILAKIFVKSCDKILNKYKINHYWLTFIANDDKNKNNDEKINKYLSDKNIYINHNDDKNKNIDNDKLKGGVHSMFFCERVLDQTERLNIYDEIVKVVCNNYDKYENTFNKIIINEHEAPCISQNIDNKEDIIKSLFDISPIKSRNLLFPFGQKSKDSRQYIYYPDASYYDNSFNYSVIAVEQNINKNIDDKNFSEELTIEQQISNYDISPDSEEENILKDVEEIFNNEIIEEELKNFKKIYIERDGNKFYANDLLCKKAQVIFEFFGNIKYLSKNHKFWDILLNPDHHNEYYTKFILPYFKFLIILNIWSCDEEKDFSKYRKKGNYKNFKKYYGTKTKYEDILLLVLKQFASIIYTANNKHNRCDYTKQYDNIKPLTDEFYNNIFVKSKLNKKFLNDEQQKLIKKVNDSDNSKSNDNGKFDDSEYSDTDDNKHNDEFNKSMNNFTTIFKTYFTLKDVGFDLVKNKGVLKMFPCLQNKDVMIIVKKNIKKLENIYKNIKDDLVKIVIDFCDSIADEIEPFDESKNYNHQICENKDNELLSFYDVDDSFNEQSGYKAKNSLYIKVMNNWFLVALIFQYIQSNFQMVLTIKNVVSAFISKYIATLSTNNTSKNAKKQILIYNIRQTNELEEYPYNQWLITEDKNSLLDIWLVKLYNHYIKDQLSHVNRENKVYGFIKAMVDNRMIENEKYAPNAVKQLPHSDKDLTELGANVIKTHPAESFIVPEYVPVETTGIFPMRNGWLYFYWPKDNDYKGYDIRFEKNNKNNYTDGYTNVIWKGDEIEYEKFINKPGNEEYKTAYERVLKMCHDIYPDDDGYEYNMRLFASVLYGNAQKDIIHVMFGTGSDGKSTIMDALLSMLDAPGYTDNVYLIEHGRKVNVKSINNKGLGDVMDAATLLASNKAGSHDEGGRIKLKHKRLVTVQEPDQHISDGKLNGAIIKDITSGSAINARAIYGAGESFQANALITFQTNELPGTNDTSKGFRRRLSVYNHLAKFKTTDETETDSPNWKIGNMKKADSTLRNLCKMNLLYKQALFYILLKFARDNIKKGYRDLQNIPKPDSVHSAIETVLSNSTEYNRWFYEYLAEKDDYKPGEESLPIISIKHLINIMQRSNKEDDYRYWKRTSNDNREIKSISKALQDYFEGYIYKLKKEYYVNKNKRGVKTINNKNTDLQKFVNELTNPELCNKTKLKNVQNLAQLKEKYLEEFSINAITSAQMNDFSDLFLVGYTYNKYSYKNNNKNNLSDLDNDYDYDENEN